MGGANGNSLMKSVYTEEEFNGDIPDDFLQWML